MRFILSLFCVVFLFSCKQKSTEPLKEIPPIEEKTSQGFSESPSQGNAHLPRLKAYRNQMYMTWVEQQDSLATLKNAIYENDTWSQAKTITSGTDWFVNWADFPSLAVNDGMILTNVLQKSAEGTYDYDIKLSLVDALSQKNNLALHTDGVLAEHGFVSSTAYDGGYYVSWLDGRNTKNEATEKNQMTLRNAYVDLDGNITEETEIDARVCDCCNTATAITMNGPVVVYRDRSEGKEETRDISIVRWVDGKWTPPKTVHEDNWKINGCPVNGPAITTKEEHLFVTWFTGEGDTPRVLGAFSSDSGETFGAPIRLDNGNAIGRLDTAFLEDGSVVVSWLEPKGDDVVLQLAKVYKDGHADAPITVTQTSWERQSGFPQLEIIGNTAYLGWTHLNDDKSTEIRLKKIAL